MSIQAAPVKSTGIFCFAFVLLFLSVLPISIAKAGPAEDAAAYLVSQQRDDGAIATPTGIATPEQATSEALIALASPGPVHDAGLAFLGSAPLAGQPTEYLARLVTASGGANTAAVAALIVRQDDAGGFGMLPGHAGNLLDTAYALQALAGVAGVDRQVPGFALSWLASRQSPSGAWNGPGGEPSVSATALVATSLWHYRRQFAVGPAVDDAVAWLLAERDGTQLWGNIETSALVLSRLALIVEDKSVLAPSLSAMRALQAPDGHWGEGVYETALALQALNRAAVPPADQIAVSGIVIDGDTGLPIANADVNLTGSSAFAAQTDDVGAFRFTFFDGGPYQLEIRHPDYGSIAYSLALSPGDARDLGVIELRRGVIREDSATVLGTLRDKLTNLPVAGATVQVTPEGRQALSDSAGQFEISDLAPGAATLTVTADGYLPISASVDLQAGQLVNFSPYLIPQTEQAVSVFGRIISIADGLPLSNVRVLLTLASGDLETVTGPDGEFRFDDLEPGAAMVRIERDGFHPVTSTWEMQAGTNYDLSMSLHPVDQAPPEPATTRFTGMVLSSADGAPLQSVRVDAVSLTDGRSVRVYTDMEGRFLVEDLDGEIRLSFARSGYYSHSLEFSMPAGVTADLGQIELRSSAFGAAAIRGRVLAGETEQPLGGVSVRIEHGGATTTVSTNGAGEFYRTHINPGSVEITLNRSGFEEKQLFATVIEGEILQLGDVWLRPADETDPRADLVVKALDASSVTSDPQSFDIAGRVDIVMQNRGETGAMGSIEIVAFHDRNADGDLDALDQVLGREQVALSLTAGAEQAATVPVSGTTLFRDVPISVTIDADNAIIESLERNNSSSSAGRCGGEAGGTMDLAMCMDASGSVGFSNFVLQTAGTAAAIEDPEIIPHDGRVRLSVFRFSSRTSVQLAPTYITAANAEDIAERIRNIRYTAGGTSIHSCVNTATNFLVNEVPESAYQVIDVSTDGVSSYSAGMNASRRARDLGIDSINALAVGGGAGRRLLNDMVFPQPAGGESGFVIAIDSYQEYADAIATKIRRETRNADLTAGRLQLVETAAGLVARVRVANAGNGVVDAGVPVVVHAGGREIGRVTLPELGESNYIDLDIPLSEAPLNGETLAVIVDPDATVSECGTTNNRIEIEATGVRADIEILPSSAVFFANETARFVTTFRNTGQIAGEFQPRVWLEDLGGSLVADLGAGPWQPLAPGEAIDVAFDWPTGVTLAGSYRARAELVAANGEIADTADALFAIEHDASGEPLASLRLVADRLVYHTTDTAHLDMLIRNLSANAIVDDAQVRISVFRADGTLLDQAVHALGDLLPGGMREPVSAHSWFHELPGEFSAVGELVDGAGNVLATQNVTFDVEEQLARAIHGTVAAEHAAVPRSEPQFCDVTVDYQGTRASLPLAARLNVVSIEHEQLLETREFVLNLESGEPFSTRAELDTWPYPEGAAACLLEARIDGTWQPLDNAAFRIDPPPIRIAADVFGGERGRLLVLLDPACTDLDPPQATGGTCDADPYGPNDAAPLPIQRDHLEAVLDAAGWTYTIVTSAEDFETEFESQGYELYALFNEQVKLPVALQRDVVADIAAGRGLLVAGNHDRRNGKLEEALGIKSLGKNLEVEKLVVTPFGEHAGGEIAFNVAHWPNAVRLEGADVIGEFHLAPKGNKTPGPEPALTQHAYEQGSGVYGSFDWPAQSALQGDTGELAGLLTASLDVAHPQPYAPIAGRVFPLHVALENEGIAIPGEVRLALPPGTSVIEGPAGTVVADNIATWPFTLTEAELQTFTVWLRLPPLAGPLTLEAVIYAGEGDELAEYARAQAVLDVQPEE